MSKKYDMTVDAKNRRGGGLKSLNINAYTKDAALALEEEYERILKLLERPK